MPNRYKKDIMQLTPLDRAMASLELRSTLRMASALQKQT